MGQHHNQFDPRDLRSPAFYLTFMGNDAGPRRGGGGGPVSGCGCAMILIILALALIISSLTWR